ncbi:HAD family hydrolase [Jannaschia pohangensis]|uniref:Phosphoglycolate phosphatase n=1 Tax=Jannaschia pohangensis TaxID=390807 RepID=A0A1I3RZ56_9RHOB|nr:HAD-IA family hydrolase [Jannaschia pohangensis]SFJ50561.1 phosphoglycolate phosphatase [Jannaschia pohangensis]
MRQGDFLALFDVDGTLIDSRDVIVRTMQEACEWADVSAPTSARITELVGLSLPVMIARLLPDATADGRDAVLAGYRERFCGNAEAAGEALLYPGVSEGLRRLRDGGIMLGVATGKNRRGLDRLIGHYGWEELFVTLQCADAHPSKPDPSMVHRAVEETGVDRSRAAMIGDTVFDMDMARAGGMAAIGVAWGYHPEDALRGAGATPVAQDFAALVQEIERRAR